MTGNASFNLANTSMFGLKNASGAPVNVGLLELNIGKKGLSGSFGMGGTDISYGTIASALSGFIESNRVVGAKVENLAGDDQSLSKLNAINGLGWTSELGDKENLELAKNLWSGKVKSKFVGMKENEFGRFDENDPSMLLLSNALRGNDMGQMAKLASVMSHEGFHQSGHNIETEAFTEGLKTYAEVNAFFKLKGDQKFAKDMISEIMNPENAKATEGNIHHWLIREDGQIFNDGKSRVAIEIPVGMQSTAFAEGLPSQISIYDDGTLDGGLAFILGGMKDGAVNSETKAAARSAMEKNGYHFDSKGGIQKPSVWDNFFSNYGNAESIKVVGGGTNNYQTIQKYIYNTISENSNKPEVVDKLKEQLLVDLEIGIAGGWGSTAIGGSRYPELDLDSVFSKGIEKAGNKAAASETSILQKYVSQAAKQVDAAGMDAFTPAQRAAIARNPNLQAMFRGSQIDKAARELIKNDPAVAGLNGMVNKGPDFINKATGQWWDMTTPGQWAAHVKKYGPVGGTLLITK